MNSQIFRGVLKGQTVVVLDKPAPLPDGTPVTVTPLCVEAGTPAAVLAAMEAEPHLSREDIGELEKAIEAGRRPPTTINPFADRPMR